MLEFEPFLARALSLETAAALFCGGIIGLDRQIRGKPVGLRTCVIIVMASALFVLASVDLTGERGDPSRVLAAVATGVGFLGAGVIISENGRVQGVTTAALIWMLAAIGAIIGLGHPLSAVLVSVIVMAVIGLMDFAEKRLKILREEFKPHRHEG